MDEIVRKNNEELDKQGQVKLRNTKAPKKWLSESYVLQSREIWPGKGQHILAQFDEEGIVVYQAYKQEIAEYAVSHQKFSGCRHFNEARMTWIKTNFLWMMYRSKWGSRPNQTNLLAIWLKRQAFELYLETARRNGSTASFPGTVRLQWDPDHFPNGENHPLRRALQLGLKNVKTFVGGEDILWIEDISEFVYEQRRLLSSLGHKNKAHGHLEQLRVAKERVYTPESTVARESVQLSVEAS